MRMQRVPIILILAQPITYDGRDQPIVAISGLLDTPKDGVIFQKCGREDWIHGGLRPLAQ